MRLKKFFESWNLRKDLCSLRGQAVAEYIVLFTAIAVGVFLVFRGVNPEKIRNGSINGAVDNATDYLVGWKNDSSARW